MHRILVIDDDPQMREMLSRYLGSEGLEVTVAENGKKGLQLFESKPYELVIIDLIMPEKEGLETIRELKKTWPHTKIIAMSGGLRGGAMDFLPAARHMGAARTFPKPFEPDLLGQAVQELLEENGAGKA